MGSGSSQEERPAQSTPEPKPAAPHYPPPLPSPPLPSSRTAASSKPPSSPPPYAPKDTNPYAHQPPKTPNPVNPTETTSPSISKRTVDNGFVIVERQKNVSKTPTSLYPNIALMNIDVTVPPPSISNYPTDALEEESTVLNCPVCDENLTLPIIVCESGHSVCNTCRQCAPWCIICRRPNTTIRNIALESLLKKDGQRQSKPTYHKDEPSVGLACSVCNDNPNIPCGICQKYSKAPPQHHTTMQNGATESFFAKNNIACPNAAAGCTFRVSASGFDRHRQDCYYRSIACPRALCYWENRLVDILQHFSSVHVVDPQQNQIELNKNFTFKILLDESMADVQVLQHREYNKQYNDKQPQPTTNYKQRKSKNHYFIYTFRSNAGLLLWTLQRFGSDADASRWLYDLTLIDNADPKRQIIWTEKCESDAQYSQTVMDTGRCVAVPLSVAKNFMSNDNRITIRIFVRPKKTQE